MLLNHEQLFVYTINDLRSKIAGGTEYELIRACGLCRHLICDKSPLAVSVNKKYKLKILFHVADFSNHPIMQLKLPIAWTTIEPTIQTTKYVGLKEFLSIILLSYYQYDYTVNDVIRAASHYFGGIHSEKPENKKQGYLTTLDKAAHADEKLTFMAIRAICKVVLKAMEPLESVINKQFTAN